ncbi:hypothetical protein D3C75_1217840 [compost metagenome]
MLDTASGSGQQACVDAIGLADDGRQIAQIGEVDLAVGKGFVDHRPRPFEVIPLDRDAVGGEGFFQQLLIAQYIRHPASGVLGASAQVGDRNANLADRSGLGQRR